MKKLQLAFLTILTIAQLSLTAQNNDYPTRIKVINGVPHQMNVSQNKITKDILSKIHVKINALMKTYGDMYQKVCMEKGNLVPANWIVRYKNIGSQEEGQQWCYISQVKEEPTYYSGTRQISFLADLNEFIQDLAQEDNLLTLQTQSGTRTPIGMELIKYNNPAYFGQVKRVGAGLQLFTLYLKTPYRK